MKSRNINISPNQSNFIDCGETVKVEDIKEEMNEEESVDDPLSIQGQINSNVSENIVTEVKEELNSDDPLCINDTTNEDLLDQDNINEGNNLNVNNMDEEVIDNIEENVNEVEGNVIEVEGNVNEVEGNVNDVEGNVVGQGNINYEVLQNLSVIEALAFFSS
jgi:hypothetical protein